MLQTLETLLVFFSFKDALKGKPVDSTDRIQNLLGTYIVEQMDKGQTLDVKAPKVKTYFDELQTMALICCLNGF